jgi:hypothetical protein
MPAMGKTLKGQGPDGTFVPRVGLESHLLIFTNQKPPAAAKRGQDSLANRPHFYDDWRLYLREHLLELLVQRGPYMRFISLALVSLALLPITGQAEVLTLTMSDVLFEANSKQSASVFNDTGSVRSAFAYDFELLKTGGTIDALPGHFVEAKGRYSATASRQLLSPGPSPSQTFTNSYDLSFSINGLPDSFPFPIRIDVTSTFLGEGNRLAGTSDITFSSSSIDRRSYATNLYSPAGSSIAIPDIGVPANSATNFTAADVVQKEAGFFTRRGGTYFTSFEYDMTLTSLAEEAKTGGDIAFRLGKFSGFDGSAADYPGIHQRDALADGHYVTVRFTVLPEASSLTLLGISATGAVGWVIRTRRNRSVDLRSSHLQD